MSSQTHHLGPTDPNTELQIGDLIHPPDDLQVMRTGIGAPSSATPYTHIIDHYLLRHDDRPNELVSVPMWHWTRGARPPRMIVNLARSLDGSVAEVGTSSAQMSESIQMTLLDHGYAPGEVQYGWTVITFRARRFVCKVLTLHGSRDFYNIELYLLNPNFSRLPDAELTQHWADQEALLAHFNGRLMPSNVRLGMDSGEIEFMNSEEQWRPIGPVACQVIEKPKLNRGGKWILTGFTDTLAHFLQLNDYFRNSATQRGRKDKEKRDRLKQIWKEYPRLKEALGLIESSSDESSADSGSVRTVGSGDTFGDPKDDTGKREASDKQPGPPDGPKRTKIE